MPPISNFWPPLEESLEVLDEPTHKRITSLHRHLCESTITVSVEDVVSSASTMTMTLWERVETWALDVYSTSRGEREGMKCRMIRDQWTWGQSFLVYEIVFYRDRGSEQEEDDDILESWVVRFGLPPYEGDEFFNTPDQLERKILNEVGALKVVKARCPADVVPVPDVWGFCARHGQEFQRIFGGIVDEEARRPHPLGPSFPAFILMSAMKGKTIEECGFPVHELGIHFDELDAPPPAFEDDNGYLSSPILRTYLKSLAKIHYALSQVTFDKIGSFVVDEETGKVEIGPMAEFGLGPFEKAEEYFGVMGEAFNRIAEASAAAALEEDDEESEDEEETNPLNLRSSQIAGLKRQFTASLFPRALRSHLSPQTNMGPFPLRHGDLHSENILVDEETGEIVGVIDWEGAGTVPWEVAGALNWEVQGEVVEWDGNVKPRRTGVHTAFNEALKEVETEISKSLHQRRPSLHRRDQSTEDEEEVYSTPMSTLSPSSSYTSLVSSSEGGHSALSGRTHSRSSSSSHLTAVTSPPTSPASSMFDVNKNSSSMSMKGAATSILEQVTRLVDTNKTPNANNNSNTATSKIKKISSFFSRSASEPQSAPPPPPPPPSFPVNNTNYHRHIRTDSLCPEIIESIRASPPTSPPSTPSKILKSPNKANAKQPSPQQGAGGPASLQNPLSLPTIPTLSLSVAALAITGSSPQPLRLNSAHTRQATAPATTMRRSPSPSPSPGTLSPPEMLSRSPSTGAPITSPSPRYHRYTGSIHKRRMSSHFREFPVSSYTGGLSVPSSPVLLSGAPHSPIPGYGRRVSPNGSPGSTSPLLSAGKGGESGFGGRAMVLPTLTRTPSPSNGHHNTTVTTPGPYGPPTPRHPHGYAHSYAHSHGHVKRPSSWYLGLSGVPLTPATPTAASMGLGSSPGGLKRSMSTSGATTTTTGGSGTIMKTAPTTPVPAPPLTLPSLSASTSASSGEYFSASSSMSSGSIEPSLSRRRSPPPPLPLSLPPAINETPSESALKLNDLDLDAKPLPSLPPPAQPSPTLQVARSKSQLSTTEPTPVKKLPPISLSDLHASVGSYVAGYLSHWMIVFGCEWETVGRALFDVVDQEELCKLGPVDDGKDRAEEAFWRWVEEQRQQIGLASA